MTTCWEHRGFNVSDCRACVEKRRADDLQQQLWEVERQRRLEHEGRLSQEERANALSRRVQHLLEVIENAWALANCDCGGTGCSLDHDTPCPSFRGVTLLQYLQEARGG